MVIERTGSRSTIERIPYERAYPEGFEELGRRIPDASKIRAAVGWQPSRTLAQMVDDAAASIRERAEEFADAPVPLD